MQNAVNFLGHRVEENGIKPLPEKVTSISLGPRPLKNCVVSLPWLISTEDLFQMQQLHSYYIDTLSIRSIRSI
ncbi:hypothetical protein FF38_07256 [Lucilia cuprina]|uniref:Uncharacterized protein n=1 Tax=Lucilia cuprina TaxID=7375 RepID=A0A0L0BZN6_LUCCU|nr:hypothetical protein FF38_07256 [Lucilia cuprina]